jgi:hypothetical protein
MPAIKFTQTESENIQKHFGKPLSSLDLEIFKQTRNQLRLKYHPDKFEQYANETVNEIINKQFLELEALFKKMEQYFESDDLLKQINETEKPISQPFLHPNAQYGFEAMKIEIIAIDKDLKYHLFGSGVRWLEMGEKYKIPGASNAHLILEAEYQGRSIGFTEAVKMYLTFGVQDSITTIIEWLYAKLPGKATSLIIEGNIVKIDLTEMTQYIKRKSFLQIGPS